MPRVAEVVTPVPEETLGVLNLVGPAAVASRVVLRSVEGPPSQPDEDVGPAPRYIDGTLACRCPIGGNSAYRGFLRTYSGRFLLGPQWP